MTSLIIAVSLRKRWYIIILLHSLKMHQMKRRGGLWIVYRVSVLFYSLNHFCQSSEMHVLGIICSVLYELCTVKVALRKEPNLHNKHPRHQC